MTALTTDDKTAVGGVLSTPVLDWMAATVDAALLVRVADCCGVLDQLGVASAVPAIAHVGEHWAFFVDRYSLAALFEGPTQPFPERPVVDFRGMSADVLARCAQKDSFWVVPPSSDRRPAPLASDVVAAIGRAARSIATGGENS